MGQYFSPGHGVPKALSVVPSRQMASSPGRQTSGIRDALRAGRERVPSTVLVKFKVKALWKNDPC